MKKIILTLLFILISSNYLLNAQNTNINNEVGVFLGPIFMQTDYGQAKNFNSSINNKGFGFGIAYIADFSNSKTNSGIKRFFTEHTKLRLELSYSKTNFSYDGKPVENERPQSDRFKSMKGNTKLLNIGVFSEIYPINTVLSEKKLHPLVLLGASYVSAKPSLKSSMELPSIFLPVEENVFLDKQSTLSFTAGLGARYKLDDMDFVLEYRFNMFMSDRIEGLDSDISGDNNNDSASIFNLGVIFNLY